MADEQVSEAQRRADAVAEERGRLNKQRIDSLRRSFYDGEALQEGNTVAEETRHETEA